MMKHIICAVVLMVVMAACGSDEPKPNVGTPEAVDLGLSVKWASYNVGAMDASNYGGLYCWADTTGSHRSLDGIDLEFHDLEGYVKCTWKSIHYGGLSPMSDISGKACDIATYKWGSEWRIPTQAEMQELITKCKWTEETVGATHGWRVTGPSGKSIFMPAAGMRVGDNTDYRGSVAYYWTSTLLPASQQLAQGYDCAVPCAARAITVMPGKAPVADTQLRCYGLSVRAVHK